MNSFAFVLLATLAVASGQFQARQAQILKLENQVTGDGQFQYAYQTEDGIQSEAKGTLTNTGSPDGPATAIQGSYSYTGPDNQVYTVSYIADEYGYRASGAHLPQAPAVPEAIQRSLQVQPQAQIVQQTFQSQPQIVQQTFQPAFQQSTFNFNRRF